MGRRRLRRCSCSAVNTVLLQYPVYVYCIRYKADIKLDEINIEAKAGALATPSPPPLPLPPFPRQSLPLGMLDLQYMYLGREREKKEAGNGRYTLYRRGTKEETLFSHIPPGEVRPRRYPLHAASLPTEEDTRISRWDSANRRKLLVIKT